MEKKAFSPLADVYALQGSEVGEKDMETLLEARGWGGVRDPWDLWVGAGSLRLRTGAEIQGAAASGACEGRGQAESAVLAMFAAEDAERERKRDAICEMRGVRRKTVKREASRHEDFPDGLDEW